MSAQNKNSNWLGWRIYDVLDPQTDKIKDVVHNQHLTKGGWEGWAQFEIAYGLNEFARTVAEAENANGDECLVDVAREEDYPATNQRWDFYMSGLLAADGARARSETYFFELKCQSGNESMDEFVYRVNADINKIAQLRAHAPRLQGGGGTHQAVWMIAITTPRERDDEDVKMQNLANNWNNFDWQVIPMPGFGKSKIWTSHIQMLGNTEDSLFAY